MKFLCLAYEEEQKLDALSESEWHTLRQETLDYVEALRAAGRLIDAQPLQSATTAATVRVRDGRAAVVAGPFAETTEQIGGYFLIEVADLDEAIAIAAQWPSARIGTIEVRPLEAELRLDKRYG
jgi:hypothetical protein